MNEAVNHSQWKRMRFKGNKVWMAVDAEQQPMLVKGKVRIKYQLDQPHEYWVLPSNLFPVDAQAPPPSGKVRRAIKTAASGADRKQATISPQACENAICVYTDGACSGNPGPAGIGVVMRYKENTREISRYLGQATNNIAELEAIRLGLLAVKNRNLPVILFTDSSYAFGLLTQNWKAKLNIALVEEIRKLAATFKQLRFVKVKGHAGHPENERADRLAVQAIRDKTT